MTKTFASVRYEFYEAKIGNVLQTYQMNFKNLVLY